MITKYWVRFVDRYEVYMYYEIVFMWFRNCNCVVCIVIFVIYRGWIYYYLNGWLIGENLILNFECL